MNLVEIFSELCVRFHGKVREGHGADVDRDRDEGIDVAGKLFSVSLHNILPEIVWKKGFINCLCASASGQFCFECASQSCNNCKDLAQLIVASFGNTKIILHWSAHNFWYSIAERVVAKEGNVSWILYLRNDSLRAAVDGLGDVPERQTLVDVDLICERSFTSIQHSCTVSALDCTRELVH